MMDSRGFGEIMKEMKCLLKSYQKRPRIFITPRTGSLLRRFNIKSEMRSFKSNENIHKKESGSYYVVSANKASSVTL